MPIALGAVGQIHFSVTDVERSVAFYRGVLGLEHLFTVPGLPMAFFQAGEVRLYLDVLENEEVSIQASGLLPGGGPRRHLRSRCPTRCSAPGEAPPGP